jgi:hypothetical protein
MMDPVATVQTTLSNGPGLSVDVLSRLIPICIDDNGIEASLRLPKRPAHRQQ